MISLIIEAVISILVLRPIKNLFSSMRSEQLPWTLRGLGILIK